MKPASGISYERRLVSPVAAAQWLECNRKNRPLTQSRVDVYADAMKRHQWGESNDAIAFDSEGNLINGQHRLSAIVKSGVSVWLEVKRGLPVEAFVHMDTHAKRKASDVLGIDGENNANLLAAIVRFVIAADRGLVFECAPESWRGPKKIGLVSVDDMRNFIEKNPDIRETVQFVRMHRAPKGTAPGSVQGLIHHFGKKIASSEEADKFIIDISEGAGMDATDPVYRTRERLLSIVASGQRMSDGVRIDYLVRAWNHRRRGTKLNKLQRGRFSYNGAEVEHLIPRMI